MKTTVISRFTTTSIAFLAALLLVVFASASIAFGDSELISQAQPPEGRWSLKLDGGVLFVWNRKELSFTLTIKGKDVRSMDDPNNIFLVVDGKILQIQSLPITNFAPDARKNKLDDQAVLLAHRDWEATFLQNELLHAKITLKTSSEKLPSGISMLVWQYDLPQNLKNQDATGQMYLSRVEGDYVILLNTVLNPSVPESDGRRFLLETISTLKTSPDKFDIKKLQDAIRSGSIGS